MNWRDISGFVFNIQHYSLHDGPGIRTLVFLKGCSLRCVWCCNPESQSPFLEVGWDKSKCIHCYSCIDICGSNSLSFQQEGLRIDRTSCDLCLKCEENCQTGAIRVFGKNMLASEVISEVMKDFEFYLDDGGVTLTGGEPLLQEKFSISILSGCKRQGLSTAIETAGNVPWFQMKGVLEHTDFILYDLKHINSEKHNELTGSGNELILDNLFRADRVGKKIFIRYPFIPCFNEDEKDLPKLFDVLRKLSNLEGIEV